MNRAEKRRQKTLAKKACRTNKQIKLLSPSLDQQTFSIQDAINLGLQYQREGCLHEAENIYRQVLQVDPNQAVALHWLGVMAFQSGKKDEAIRSISKSLTMNPDYFEAHYHLGVILNEIGRLDEAIASFRAALVLNPENAETHYNLGNALGKSGRPEEAVASYHKAIGIKADFSEALINLGVALMDMENLEGAASNFHKTLAINPNHTGALVNLGRIYQEWGKQDKAEIKYRKALTLNPEYATAHFNLGNVLEECGQLDEAVRSYRKALAINPDYAKAHNNLGYTLQQLGRMSEAFESHRYAVALNPDNVSFLDGLALSIRNLSFTSVDDGLWETLLLLVEHPSVRPSSVIQPAISALRHHPDISRLLELTDSEKLEVELNYVDAAEPLSAIPLLLQIMKLSPIKDLAFERLLTNLRHALLMETMGDNITEKGLLFSTSLALQSFANEYIFSETLEEMDGIVRLEQRIEALMEQAIEVPPFLIVTLGTYRPLNSFAWSGKLDFHKWSSDVKDVIKRQISEPIEEQALRAKILNLTSIHDAVSKSVRQQYEDNPYPRWIKTGVIQKGKTISDVFKGFLAPIDFDGYVAPEQPKVLVAGCGTGQHALITASLFSNAQVTAIDLSLSSLSYALRKTRELNITNIDYRFGDILELANFEQRFDLIECAGVLHHLHDPMAGWRVLTDRLKPRGVMKVALYSELARQDITFAQELISERGYQASPMDIRQCRQDIVSMAKEGNPLAMQLCKTGDFFSMSECRDLIFHVQEHRFTLPQIQKSLDSLKLKFMGFEMWDQLTLNAFKKSYPEKGALTSLPLWHEFEMKHPATFKGMYQFWCHKN